MPRFLRSLLGWALVFALAYWYANTYGLFLGYPPFTSVLLYNYSGTLERELLLRGASDGIKLKVQGALSQGILTVTITRDQRTFLKRVFTDTFGEEIKKKLTPGRYRVRFAFEDARGWVRLDWVSTKFNPW